MTKLRLIALLLGVGLLLPIAARAQQPAPPSTEEEDAIETDRPDFTESSNNVPYRRLQIEAGYTLNSNDTTKFHTFGEVLLRYGMTRRAELRVALNSIALLNSPGANTAGTQDVMIGTKWKLWEAAEGFGLKRPQASLIAQFAFPSGSGNFRENALQFQTKLCLGWDLSPTWTLGSNINYTGVSSGGQRFDQMSLSITLGRSWNSRIASYFELFGFLPGAFQGGNITYFDTGATYLVNKNLQLDFRVGLGMNGVRDDYFVGFGVSKRW
jgi:hypothetical protein